MAEVAAIFNARQPIPVSSDPESPLILSLAMILTLKTGSAPPPPPGNFEEADLFREEWKQFRTWQTRFGTGGSVNTSRHCSLVTSGKEDSRALEEGDIVLPKDNDAKRNDCPMGIITKVIGWIGQLTVEVIGMEPKSVSHAQLLEVVLLLSPKTDSVCVGSLKDSHLGSFKDSTLTESVLCHGNIEIVHPGKTECKHSVRQSVAVVLRHSWLVSLAPQLRPRSSFSLFAKVMSVSIIHTVVRLSSYFMLCGNCVANCVAKLS